MEKHMIDRLMAVYSHSLTMFRKTDDTEYYGQALAIEAMLSALRNDFTRLDHMATYVKKAHRNLTD